MLALALILATDRELALPPTLEPALTVASRALFRVEYCSGKSQHNEDEFARRDQRYFRLSWSALQVWGAKAERDIVEEMRLHLRCGAKRRNVEIARFDAAISEAERIFEQAILPMRQGVWIGALRLCRETVARTEPALNIVDNPVLRVTLTSGTRARLATLSEKIMTGRYDSGQIALRVNGVVLSELMVYERIESAVIDLPAPTSNRPDFPALAGPLGEPC
ncbi:hypothetical protein [Sphingomonas sp. KR3-1]|uniref:hypothetical protein n=1 Tax=Sphingomonas sp. KR3-1 TaxID=3156611 RepID=UPI0032B416AC